MPLRQIDFPKLQVAPDVEIWLRAAYERVKAGKAVEPQQMLIELWQRIPDFDYKAIDNRIMNFGVQPTLLGILQIDPNTELAEQTDRVIRFVKEVIKGQPAIESITAQEVADELEMPLARVALLFLLMTHLGKFWFSASGGGNGPGYTSLTIRDEDVKREYLRYESLESLLRRFAKIDENVSALPKVTFVHTLLDFKLNDRLEAAVRWIDGLPADEIKALKSDSTSVRFAISIPIVADEPVRDERMAELEDLTIDRKTGATGHIVLLTIEEGVEWFQEIRMQSVTTDSHPLAFLDANGSCIYIKLTVSPGDPDGTLKIKLNERLTLVRQYCAYVAERIIQFNKELAHTMKERLDSRKAAILKGESEAEALGLSTKHNPRYAETTRLMNKLRDRLIDPKVNAMVSTGDLSSATKQETSDLLQNAFRIAAHLYSGNYVTGQGTRVGELRDRMNISDEIFDLVDSYLLNAGMVEGTAGGDAGTRWLTPKGVDFVSRNGDAPLLPVANVRDAISIDIFISHSSKDIEIAKALATLFRAALNIPANRIRCTSVDGHRLPAGANADDRLRAELRESKVFLGLITKASLESAYVLFELGARWGAGLPLVPVLVNFTDKTLLPGPLASLSALACDSRAQLLQLLDDVALQLGAPIGKPASYLEQMDAVLLASGGDPRHLVQKLSSADQAINFDRMAQHVKNYFTAKRVTKHVGFETLRKYVNGGYTDQMLFEMIDRFPQRFRRVTLRSGKPAVGLIRAII